MAELWFNVKIEQEVDINVDVVCNVCGRQLKVTQSGKEIIVDPCEKCLEKTKEQ